MISEQAACCFEIETTHLCQGGVQQWRPGSFAKFLDTVFYRLRTATVGDFQQA